MRKWMAFVLASLLLLSLCGCGMTQIRDREDTLPAISEKLPGVAGGTKSPVSMPEETEKAEDRTVLPGIRTEKPLADTSADYILNRNSFKFHYPDCSSVGDMKEKNKIYFDGTREEAIAQGYVPCKLCCP